MHMTRPTERWLRLGLGVALNIVVLALSAGPTGRWGGYDQEAHFAVINIAVAALAFVTIIPLFWRGESWQAAVALLLLLAPFLVLWTAVETIANH
jgi:hypothetical protein